MDKKANPDLPLGLGMALAQNVEAMQAFSEMSPEGKQEVIEKAHGVSSKKEMSALVAEIGKAQL